MDYKNHGYFLLQKIFNLLRIITYTTAGDTWLTEDNLWDIEALPYNKNKGIEIKLFNEEKEQSFYNADIYYSTCRKQ